MYTKGLERIIVYQRKQSYIYIIMNTDLPINVHRQKQLSIALDFNSLVILT